MFRCWHGNQFVIVGHYLKMTKIGKHGSNFAGPRLQDFFYSKYATSVQLIILTFVD